MAAWGGSPPPCGGGGSGRRRQQRPGHAINAAPTAAEQRSSELTAAPLRLLCRNYEGGPLDRYALIGNYAYWMSTPPCVTTCSTFLNSQDDQACPLFGQGVPELGGDAMRGVYGACWAKGSDTSARLEVVPLPAKKAE